MMKQEQPEQKDLRPLDDDMVMQSLSKVGWSTTSLAVMDESA